MVRSTNHMRKPTLPVEGLTIGLARYVSLVG